MANKGRRRYKRHQEKHRTYFEALARELVTKRKITVDFGVNVFEARLRKGSSWLDIRQPDGPWDDNASIAFFRGDALVSVITDYLIRKTSQFPGVEIPPPESA